MIDIVVQHQALIREWINGSSMILCLTLTCMISIFMWDTALDWYSQIERPRGRSWTKGPGVQTACALWWVFAAETYRSGAVWVLYQMGKAHGDVGVFFNVNHSLITSYGYLLAGIALNLGLLRAIYIFTPPEWKSKVWVYSAIGALLFCAMPSFLSLLIRIYIDEL
jgi:hypothetical protein